ncbi:GGDEF domain-containing protein [Marinicella litoralis]|uniref:diguanylate cyclase n=1 Tax=Marinicella litoralis TaxID=644220 RepID=A0A4R6XS38_9GAMM|nr:GGDEF domain-containing protein [Marinicella litoralis]TDR22735.1 diguanylate cyclase [Marinicella litoralis]
MSFKLQTLGFVLLLTIQVLNQASASTEDLAPQYQKFNKDLGTNPQQVLSDMALIAVPPENTHLKAQHHYTLSLAYLTLAYPQKSLTEANLALDNLAENQADWLYHSIMVVKTQAMELSGQAKEALPLIKQTVEWATENNNKELLIDALVGLGYIENTLREPVKALDAFMQAYELAPSKDAIVTKSAIASSIALVYEYRKENELAIPYFQEAVDYHRASKNLLELSIALYGLGRANKNIGKSELGTNQLQESLDISRAIADDQGVAYALKELAPLHFENDRIDLAESMLIEAAELFELSENNFMLFDVYKTLTELYLKKNDIINAQLNLDQAKRYLNQERMPMQSIGLEEIESKLLASQGQYQLAFNQLINTVGKKQKLQAQQSTRQLHELRTQFELEEQANANLLLSQENAVQKLNLTKEKQQNQILIIAIIATTVIVLLLLLLALKSRKQKQLLFQSANFDSLTRLANRSYIWQQLDQYHQQLKSQQTIYLAMLDLDHFKQINDQLGHDVGDQVLQAMGKICQQNIQPPNLVGRFGGEEFLLAFIDIEYSEIHTIIENIRQQAKRINIKNDLQCPTIGFSVGIATCKADDSLKEKIKVADLAMYEAKNTGRNKTVSSQL